MPGLFGLACRDPSLDLESEVEGLLPPASDRWVTELLVDHDRQWALGRVHLGVLQPGVQLTGNPSVQALFHGDLSNADDLEAGLGEPVPEGVNRAAWLVAALYDRYGAGFAARLDGAFCCALVDRLRHRLVLVSDLLGSYPIYWAVSGKRLLFASELRALVSRLDARPSLNAAAAADFVTFGFPLGVKTLAEGVDLVPPGAAVVFDWDAGTTTVRQYASVVDAFDPWQGTKDHYLDAAQEAFADAVKRALAGPHHFGLALSGGLDSRAILSAVNGDHASLATCTLGVKGCADQAIAKRLARVSGTDHRFFELDDAYLRDFLPNLRRMVSLTDGMYLSHGLTEMLALHFLVQTDITVLLRGHGGELAKTRLAWPLHTDDRISTFKKTEELVPYLLGRVNYVSPGLEWHTLFTKPWLERMRDQPRASLEDALADVPLAPSDLCSYLYLTEHHRRFTVPSLELFRQAVEVRLPFVDPGFLNVLFRGQALWREDRSIHKAVIAAGKPALLRIRDSNTGAAVDADPTTALLLDRINTVFKRLHVPGYRHYHDFQGWMKEQLLGSVEAVLFDHDSLDRGMLLEPGLRRLVEETRRGRGDHSYLLTVLLILELWQQDGLDHRGTHS